MHGGKTLSDSAGLTQPDEEVHHSAGVRASLLEYLHGCPVCTGTDLRHYCRVASRFNAGEFLHYERCRRCGVVLRNPRLPAAYRLDRYADRIFSVDAKQLDPHNQLHYWYMTRVLRRQQRALATPRLLDFGCGAGGFLVEAQAGGFKVMGLEINRDLATHVHATYGIPVHCGQLDDAQFSGELFDVVVSSQVFEHLLDPRRTVHALREHLVASGLLLIEVPNLEDTRERVRRGVTMDDAHLFYFNRASLTRLLRDGGYRVLATYQGLRPYRLVGERGRDVPLPVLRAAERVFSFLQVRTVLSVLAVLT